MPSLSKDDAVFIVREKRFLPMIQIDRMNDIIKCQSGH